MGRNSNFYDGAESRTYRFPAAAVDTAAVFGRFIGPAGKVGRVRGMEFLCTILATGADSSITCGNNGAVGPASMAVPAQAQFAGNAMTDAEVKAAGAAVVAGTNDVELAADTVVEVASDGGLTAGDHRSR
jgi:hypothetical protein